MAFDDEKYFLEVDAQYPKELLKRPNDLRFLSKKMQH